MRIVTCVAVTLLLLAAIAHAERLPQSRTMANLVLTGTFKAITTKDVPFGGDGILTYYTAEVVVDSLHQGAQVKVGDTISVTWFHATKRSTNKRIVGAFGHGYSLKVKDKAKLWLMDRGPQVPEGVWVIIYNKDGVEKIEK